ncbi:MAG: FecR family protein [Bacteroidota bacterium]
MTLEKENRRIQFLAKKWQDGTITEQEKTEFNDWYNSFDDSHLEDFAEETPDMLGERLFTNIQIRENISFTKKIRMVSFFRLAAAASVLLFSLAGAYWLLHNDPDQPTVKNVQKDRLPGTNKAVLMLANGSKISLDDAVKGELAKQSGITITKAGDGQIIYTVADHVLTGAKPGYNTIETPRGGQIKVNLPDGTKVWLNAASFIKFPTNFSGSERNVTLEGEAYFEVAHNANKPFNVYATGIAVHVLGTHFNINAYKDEDTIKTTLMKGSVRLTAGHASALLKPGQQGGIIGNGSGFNLSAVDTSLVMAWKNDLFKFNNTDLHTLMRQISRWYNIDVVYQSGVPNDVFFGNISRQTNLSKVLKILELGGVHFKIEDKKLIVMP